MAVPSCGSDFGASVAGLGPGGICRRQFRPCRWPRSLPTQDTQPHAGAHSPAPRRHRSRHPGLRLHLVRRSAAGGHPHRRPTAFQLGPRRRDSPVRHARHRQLRADHGGVPLHPDGAATSGSPGTLNVGTSVPVAIEAFAFVVAIAVDPMTLLIMVPLGAVGGFVGAAVVAGLPRRPIQLGMGLALLTGALLMFLTNMQWIPGGGTAIGFSGATLVLATAGELRARRAQRPRHRQLRAQPHRLQSARHGSAVGVSDHDGIGGLHAADGGHQVRRREQVRWPGGAGHCPGRHSRRAGGGLRGEEPAARSDPLARGSGGPVCGPFAAPHCPGTPDQGGGEPGRGRLV